MKKLLFLVPIILLLASCQPYGDKITQRYLSQQGHWEPVKDSAGKIVKNELVFDSVYKIVPSYIQKVDIAKKNGTIIWFFVFGILGLASLAYSGYSTTTAPKWKYKPLFFAVTAILLLAAAIASIDWAHTKEVEIPKATYDSLKATPDGLKPFWDENLFK